MEVHWIKPDQRVANAEEEAKLGAGWADSAAAFTPYKDPARARPQHPDPLKWLADWMVPGLSPNHREKLKAQLLEAHAAFWKAPERPSAAVDSMRLAFDGIAKVLLEAEILTEQLLESDIPLLVWDSAIAGGWWHLASEERKDIFPERLGHYWVGATTVNWDRLGWRGASIPLFESKARYKERALNCGSLRHP